LRLLDQPLGHVSNAFAAMLEDALADVFARIVGQPDVMGLFRPVDAVGIFPNEEAITRLIGAILLEQNDEWAVQRSRYITLESMAPVGDNPLIGLPAVAV
jgi:hypothetical protein